jgi:biotin carboxylase
LKKKHLLILGGGALNYKSILEAKKHGFVTYVVDQNCDAPCFSIADVSITANIISAEEVLSKISHYPIDGVVSMAEAGVLCAAILTQKLCTGGIDVNTALKCTSKVAMRKAWEKIPYSVNYRVVRTYEEAVVASEELNTYPLIIKPDKTFGGSRGVSKLFSVDELKEAYLYASSSGQNEWIVIEECAEGDEFSCEVVVHNGISRVLCIGKKIKSPAPYRVDCSVQYQANLTIPQEKEVSEMCRKAAQLLGIVNGVAHVEFAYGPSGPKLFEIGARCGGGHTPLIAKHVSGINEFIEYCSIACGISSLQEPFQIKKGADYRFVIFEPGVVEEVIIPASLYSDPMIYDIAITVKKGDTIEDLKNTSARAGAVVILTENLNEAVTKGDEICRKLQVKYANGDLKSACLFNEQKNS